METTKGLLGLTALVVIYLLPSLIAYYKEAKYTSIIMFLNILFGWTILGWIVPMILALLPKK